MYVGNRAVYVYSVLAPPPLQLKVLVQVYMYYSVPQYKSTLSLFCFFQNCECYGRVLYIKMIINLF